MSTDIQPYEATPLPDRIEYARQLANAGDLIPTGLHDPVFREVNGQQVKISGQVGPVNPGKVLLVMEYGAMLGLHPIAALSGVHVIEGKPAASAAIISGVVRSKGIKLRVTTKGTWESGDFEATATLTRPDDPEFTYSATWTKARAERAQLLGKDNWKKYPEAMCKARAITEVCREGAEDALMGVHYTPEELDAPTDERGEWTGDVLVLDGQGGEQAKAAPSAKPKRTATNGRQGTRKAKAAEPEQVIPVEVVEDAATGEAIYMVGDAEGVHEVNAKTGKTVERTPEQQAYLDGVEATLSKSRGTEVLATDEEMAQFGEAERERAEREQMAAEQAAKVAADEAKAEADAKLRAEHEARKAEREAEKIAGQTADQAASLGEQRQAERDNGNVFAALVSEAASEAQFTALLSEAKTTQQVKAVWDRATEAKLMTSALRIAIVRRKAEVEQA